MTKLEAYWITQELDAIEQLAIIAASLDTYSQEKAVESFEKLSDMAGSLRHIILENVR